MPEKYICMTCEENKRSFIVDAGADGKCSVCGSDKIVTASAFVTASQSLANASPVQTKNKAAKTEASVLATAKQKRIDHLADYYKTVRDFLDRNNLHDLNLWWDGWSLRTDNSILPDDPSEAPSADEFDWFRVTLKNANGDAKTFVCYFDPGEESRFSVSEIKRSPKKN